MPLPHRVAALLALGPLACFASQASPPLSDLAEIPSPALAGSAEPNLATGADGRVYLSWIDPLPGGSHALRFAVFGGRAWSTPRTIASGPHWFVNWADFPSLTVLSESVLAAHWLVNRGPGGYAYDVYVARSADGGTTWSAPVVPHRDGTLSEHGFVSLWANRPGGLAVVWLDGRKLAAAQAARPRGDSSAVSEMTLRYATLDSIGSIGAEAELDGRVCECCQTAAVMSAAGPVVFYRDRSEQEVRDIAVVRLVNGAWTAPRRVADDGWQINGCPVNGPAAAAEGRQVAVAWFTAAQGRPRVQIAFSDDAGARFGAPIRVDDGNPVGRVAVVPAGGGAALVSWIEQVGEAAEVRVRRIEPSGARGPRLTVARTAAGRPAGFPRMTRAGGRVVLAWTDPGDGGGTRVRTSSARLEQERRR